MLAIALTALVSTAQATEVASPGTSITFGLGGTLVPMLDLAVERHVGPRDAVVVDVGLLPTPILLGARGSLGYRRYLTGGPQGGLHLGVGADASGIASFFGALDMAGVHATLGGERITASGFTFDFRVGSGIYTSSAGGAGPLPVLMMTLGHTSKRKQPL